MQCGFDAVLEKLFNLLKENEWLEQPISRFKRTNKKYLKVKSIAEEHVTRFLTATLMFSYHDLIPVIVNLKHKRKAMTLKRKKRN